MSKNKKGFTLVEVIVVAVIVMILAAVAIPLYMAYIRDSRQAVADHTAGAVAKAIGAAIQKGVVEDRPLLTGEIQFEDKDGHQIVIIRAGESEVLVPKGYKVDLDGKPNHVTVTWEKDVPNCDPRCIKAEAPYRAGSP